jgi:hypothetical protein
MIFMTNMTEFFHEDMTISCSYRDNKSYMAV